MGLTDHAAAEPEHACEWVFLFKFELHFSG
jgi:hypothetical protein